MMVFIRLFTLFIYITLLYELVVIPVPSVASTYQLFFTEDSFNRPHSLLARVRHWSLPLKVFCLALPTGLTVIVYLLPLGQAIWPALAQYLHQAVLIDTAVALPLGLLLALLGRFVGLRAAYSLHHKQAASQPGPDLKTKALFSVSRNPILLGMIFTFIGLWLIYPSWEMGLGFVLFVANMHFRIRLEEEFLSWQFGADYEHFLATTRRYL